VQPELFEPTHGSTWPDRLRTSPSERIYYERWLAENRRGAAINGGYSLLAHIMAGPSRSRGVFGRYDAVSRAEAALTNRDSIVAAGVVQWLGTNCGRGFIWACEREIDQMESFNMSARCAGPRPEYREQARLLLAPLGAHPNMSEVERAVAGALEMARKDRLVVSQPGIDPRGIMLREEDER
jgi:hypothetical protein